MLSFLPVAWKWEVGLKLVKTKVKGFWSRYSKREVILREKKKHYYR